MRAEKVGARRCSRKSCRWSRKRSAAARRSSGSPTRSPAVFVPAVIAGGDRRLRRLGASGGRSRASRTVSSRRSPCSSSPAPARWASPPRCRLWWASAAAPGWASSSRTPRRSNAGEGRHACRRQDRHAHRRQARGDRRRGRVRVLKSELLRWRPASSAPASTLSRSQSSRPRKSRALRQPRSSNLTCPPARARSAQSRTARSCSAMRRS